MTTHIDTAVEIRAIPGYRRHQMQVIGRYVLSYALLIFFAFVFIGPLAFMISSSFKTNAGIFADMRSTRGFLPIGDISLDNYDFVFERSNFTLFLQNSLFIAITNTILSLIVNSMAAFALSRLEWRGQRVVLVVIIATLIVPFETIVVPLLLLVSKLPWVTFDGLKPVIEDGWFNSFHVQIIPGVANAFMIFLFYQFFLDIPMDLDEAARVDGASSFRIYWNIILPISRPIIATVTILTFLGSWNAYLWPLLVTQSEKYRPIMPAVENFFGRTPEWGAVMAFSTLVSVPVLIVFFLFQNWFIRSIASSGIKG